jgi:hypothetical protein
MTIDQILKRWPDLAKIFVENGILSKAELNSVRVHIPEYKNIKSRFITFTAGVNGNTLTVFTEVDHHDKIIASSTEWSEELNT